MSKKSNVNQNVMQFNSIVKNVNQKAMSKELMSTKSDVNKNVMSTNKVM